MGSGDVRVRLTARLSERLTIVAHGPAMIRIMLALFALAACAAPAAAAERRYSVTDFDRVQVDGPYQVTRRHRPLRSATRERQRRRRSTGSRSTFRARRCASAATARPGAAIPANRHGPVTIALATRDLRAAR